MLPFTITRDDFALSRLPVRHGTAVTRHEWAQSVRATLPHADLPARLVADPRHVAKAGGGQCSRPFHNPDFTQ